MDNDYTKYNDIAELLKVLAHPVRICIVKGLLEKGECNVSHMQNCLDMPQSTISQHLQKLKSAGIIEGDRNGLQINYHVSNKKAEQLIKILLNE
ncbi:winged helix-turn-helix transcriptional regulator [Clostridium botulinum]|uniref:Winged helix-turn-helix transcriptional regulator n=1 Tax=Clostridium botulinum TaxID=1491 RepID=A0A846J4X5_CLOBO|nr:metalloregulator ArsR/SmtB family transcription factor [Clostridium botulinum]ACA53762.1 transcriptional regulator, ArsR family [Clostridium botulinum A3 str. Loch Maree]NFH64556.1 winged helix-turn-helix transcriptional regulator [Clostridium botulinum]NFJ08290.1 winged helix-turn-helix transcriptional regulator [Clostridium botulinum]NFK16056.1 winged helix-turn-helix transcriptional regulator [Clostridium botulinum]NFM94823.1 winged helix-turn-helix transcriptional regulator [Clostridium